MARSPDPVTFEEIYFTMQGFLDSPSAQSWRDVLNVSVRAEKYLHRFDPSSPKYDARLLAWKTIATLIDLGYEALDREQWFDSVVMQSSLWDLLREPMGYGLCLPGSPDVEHPHEPVPFTVRELPAPRVKRSPMAQLSLIGAPEPIKCRGDRPQQLGLF